MRCASNTKEMMPDLKAISRSDSSEKNCRILVIDDNRAIHEDFRKILSPTLNSTAALDATEAELLGRPINLLRVIQYEIDSAYQGQEGVELVKVARDAGRPYAMAFVDVRMPPGWDGVVTTQKIWEIDPDVQIVICTAYSDYTWNEMFEKIGDSDGLVILKKPFDTVEALQLAHALTEKWRLLQHSRQLVENLEGKVAQRTRELEQNNQTLQRQQIEMRVILDFIPAMICFKDTENRILRANQRFANHFGKSLEEVEGRSLAELLPDAADSMHASDHEVIHSGIPKLGELEKVTDFAGKDLWLQKDRVPVCDTDGRVTGIVVMGQDVTERTRIEAHLYQSQKMETVGKLAGGVAHEFNSILTAIIGQSDLLIRDLPSKSALQRNAEEIRAAAERAAILTRQLLAYGRKQILQPEILDLNAVLVEMENTLRHLMGPTTSVFIAPAAEVNLVKVDAGQIEQVIMNLAMNAAEAMPHGGRLTLETANVTLDQNYVSRFPDLKAGKYVMLAVTDTGTGMSDEVKARIFEPFFSTKAVGEGTGLGLSTSYGILKQSGGHIAVWSEPSRGTTFKVYLPQIKQHPKISIQSPAGSDLSHGTETILLVEDDPALREMAGSLLRRLGYEVLVAANGREALSVKQQSDIPHIDLLITDVVMPHMSGKELAERMRGVSPHIRTLFTSAYTGTAILHQGIHDMRVALIQKPFTPSMLVEKIRELLDQHGEVREELS